MASPFYPEWECFLESLSAEHKYSVAHINKIKLLIRDLIGTYSTQKGSIPAPSIETRSTQEIVLIWDTGQHLLELEIHTNGQIDWFYKAREEKYTEGTETPIEIPYTIPTNKYRLLRRMYCT